MNYLMTSQENTPQKGKMGDLFSMLILLSLIMGSSFIAGLTWDSYPYFTLFPALLGLALLRVSR